MQSEINLIEVLSSMLRDYLKLGADTLRKSINTTLTTALSNLLSKFLTVVLVATLLLIALAVLAVGFTAFLTEITGHLGISALIVGAIYLIGAAILFAKKLNTTENNK